MLLRGRMPKHALSVGFPVCHERAMVLRDQGGMLCPLWCLRVASYHLPPPNATTKKPCNHWGLQGALRRGQVYKTAALPLRYASQNEMGPHGYRIRRRKSNNCVGAVKHRCARPARSR
jgi:hypothetical protein